MTPYLETERIILRPMVQDDAAVRYEIFANPATVDILGADPYADLAAAERQVAAYQKMAAVNFSRHWTLALKTTGLAFGFCDVYLPSPHLRPLAVCEVAFGLVTPYRGYGYMAEALMSCLDHMIRDAHFFRFEASVSPANEASKQLLARLGFKLEGVQRQKWVWANQRHDMLGYALLAKTDVDAGSLQGLLK